MGQKNVTKLILDTNIIARYLMDDVASQADEAEKLFRKAEKREVLLLVQPVVVAEACFVMQTYYKKSEVEISRVMQPFLSQHWLDLEHGQALLGMWRWYEEGNHFVDSYLLSLEKYEGIGIYSFDKKLNKRRKK